MNRKNILLQLTALNIAHDPTAPKSHLLELLKNAQGEAKNKISKVVNYAGGRGKIEVVFNKSTSEPVQVMVCEDIGKDAWTGDGITLSDIRSALNGVETNRALDFFTNSPGGSVSEGVSIRNWLSQWEGEINNTIIGIAASTASWCIPAKNVRAYKNSQMFMHKSMGMTFGNADDHRKNIEFLDKTDGQIADMYAKQSGRPASEMMQMMSDETLLTGQEALDAGLVDELIDGDAKNQFPAEWLNSAKQKLAALNSLRTTAPQNAGNNNKQKTVIMNKEKMIALLNKWGVMVPENATDEQLTVLVEAGKPISAPVNQQAPKLSAEDAQLIADMRNQIAETRKREIRAALNRLASVEGGQRIAANEIENWEVQAIAAKDGTDGNPILNSLKKLPEQTVGVPPVGEFQNIEMKDESFKEVQKFIVANSSGFVRNFLGKNADNEIDSRTLKEIGARATVAANTILKNKKMLIEMFNTNAIDADLQRQLILQDMLEAYALNLQPLESFSIKYESVPLQGLDTVVVPYFPLQGTASTSFVKGTGYTTISDWTQNSRKVTIGGDGDAASNGANATAGTCKDRLFQAINFTSYDMRRQPYLNVLKLAQQAANKLGVDVASQIYSRVIVTGNFGAAVKTVAAALFSADDVADLSEYADTAEWPAIARSLVLTNTYKTPLLKDVTFKSALAYGSTDPIRKAMIQEAYGFENMYFVPNLAAKLAANTAGWINHKSAVLVAFAPIMPTPEVRNLLTTYDVAVEPRSGAVLEYRKFGNATTDTTTEVIESSFGAAKGVDAALKIVKSA